MAHLRLAIVNAQTALPLIFYLLLETMGTCGKLHFSLLCILFAENLQCASLRCVAGIRQYSKTTKECKPTHQASISIWLRTSAFLISSSSVHATLLYNNLQRFRPYVISAFHNIYDYFSGKKTM